MEVTVDELQHLFLVGTDVGTESAVAIRTKFLDDTVNHGRAEDVVLLERFTLALEAVGRGLTAVGEASEGVEFIGILLLVDVDIHVGLLGYLEGIIEFEAIAASHSKTRDELVDVGRAIG